MDYRKQNVIIFLKQLNVVMKEYTQLLKLALDLYKDYASENMISTNQEIKIKKDIMQNVIIKLTLSATDLISIADNEDNLK